MRSLFESGGRSLTEALPRRYASVVMGDVSAPVRRPTRRQEAAPRELHPSRRRRRPRRGRGHPDEVRHSEGAAPRSAAGPCSATRSPLPAALEPAHLVVVVRHERDAVAGHVERDRPGGARRRPGRGQGHRPRRRLWPRRPGRRRRRPLAGTVVVTYGDVPAADRRDAARPRRAPRGGRRRGDRAHARTSPTRPATAGSCGTPTATSSAIVEQKDADDAQRGDHARSTPASTPSTPACSRDALGRIGTRQRRRARSTSPTSLAHRPWRRPAGHRACASTTSGRSRASTTGCSWRRSARSSTAACSTRWMRAGVTVVDPATTWVDVDVELAPDVTLLPGTQLHGATRVAGGATIGPDTTLDRLRGRRRRRRRPHPRHRRGDRGGRERRPVLLPAARARVLGRARQDRHLRRDQERRHRRRLQGAAPVLRRATRRSASTATSAPRRSSSTTTASRKHHTTVGDHVRIGSDNMLVAPVTIGDGAYTAAGSVIDRGRPARRARRRPRPAARRSRAGSSASGRGRRRRRRRRGRARDPPRASEDRRAAQARAIRKGRGGHDRDHDDQREAAHALLRPGTPRAGPTRSPTSSASSSSRRTPTTSPTARSTSGSRSPCAAATPSSSRATRRRSTSGSWSS